MDERNLSNLPVLGEVVRYLRIFRKDLVFQDESKDKKAFRKVKIFKRSFAELGEMLEGFDTLEYKAWYDEKLRCWVCELHIPEDQERRG